MPPTAAVRQAQFNAKGSRMIVRRSMQILVVGVDQQLVGSVDLFCFRTEANAGLVLQIDRDEAPEQVYVAYEGDETGLLEVCDVRELAVERTGPGALSIADRSGGWAVEARFDEISLDPPRAL